MSTFSNSLYPRGEQLQEALQRGTKGIYMVNLLKFREKAKYDDGRKTNLSGKEAYMIYGEGVTKCLEMVGGKGLFFGNVTGLVIGDLDRNWDAVAIAYYPTIASLLEMNTLDKFKEIAEHRTAGLEGQLLIETADPAGLSKL